MQEKSLKHQKRISSQNHTSRFVVTVHCIIDIFLISFTSYNFNSLLGLQIVIESNHFHPIIALVNGD